MGGVVVGALAIVCVAHAASPTIRPRHLWLLIDRSQSMLISGQWRKLSVAFSQTSGRCPLEALAAKLELPKQERFVYVRFFPNPETLPKERWGLLTATEACAEIARVARLHPPTQADGRTPLTAALQSIDRGPSRIDAMTDVVVLTDGYPDTFDGGVPPFGEDTRKSCQASVASLGAVAGLQELCRSSGYAGPLDLLPAAPPCERTAACMRNRTNGCACTCPQRLDELCEADEKGWRFPRFIASLSEMDSAYQAAARLQAMPCTQLAVVEYQAAGRGTDAGASFLRSRFSLPLQAEHVVETEDITAALRREFDQLAGYVAPPPSGGCIRPRSCAHATQHEDLYASLELARSRALAMGLVESSPDSGCFFPQPTREPEPPTECFSPRSWTDVVAVGRDRRFFCSGVLVRKDAVLTARHCLPATEVLLGNSLKDVEAIVPVSQTTVPDDEAIDVALLKLARPLRDFEPRYIRPPSTTTLLFHVGYGALDSTGRNGFGTRHVVTFPASETECDRSRSTLLGCEPQKELVVAANGGRDTCDGDSGGGLFALQRPEHDLDGGVDAGWEARPRRCNATLVGITSRPVRGASVRCGNGGIYTRAAAVEDWIGSVLSSWERDK